MEIKNLITEMQNKATTLAQADNNVALAIVMIKTGKDQKAAAKLLDTCHGNISQVLRED
ncbi:MULTISPECIES: hypothetical protein [unclassified Lactobacillus]|uniref:hypothetical protein n=1 Tax=unclassified Lactobacillus TaxID=2620435 RepID=UPI0013143BAD|nr:MULTISPECIES: hypothetical protein [unclassified Lactobacillus]